MPASCPALTHLGHLQRQRLLVQLRHQLRYVQVALLGVLARLGQLHLQLLGLKQQVLPLLHATCRNPT